MDVERVLTLRVIDCLDEDSIVVLSSVGRITHSIALHFREAIVSRALLSLIGLLRVHTGADTIAEVHAEDDAIEAAFFRHSVAGDWDWDDLQLFRLWSARVGRGALLRFLGRCPYHHFL